MTPGNKFRSIKDVYESGIPSVKKKPKKKKFKTMGALYSEDVAEEPEIGIHAQEPGDGIEFIGNVPQSAYDKVRRAVLKNARGGANEYAKKMVENAKLEQLGRETDLAEILQNNVSDYGKLKHFMDAKAAGDLSTLENKIKAGGVFNMATVLHDQQGPKTRFLDEREGMERNFVHALARLDGAIDRVGVGPGELMCTIISNAVKGEKGDLQFPSIGEVEFKATSGRLGINNYVPKGLDNLEEYLIKRQDNFASTGYVYMLNGIMNKLNKLQKQVNINMKGSQAPEMIEQFNRINEIIARVPGLIENKEFVPNEDISLLQDTLTWDGISKPFRNAIYDLVGDHTGPKKKPTAQYTRLLDYNYFKKLVDEGTWRISTTKGYKSFFLKPQPDPLTYDEYTKGLLEMRTEFIGPDEYDSLLAGVRQVIKQEHVDKLVANGEELLEIIGAAIQITCYANGHFNYICFSDIGTSNSQGSMESIGINCIGESLGEIFVSVYKQMIKHKWTISLSVDAANKGFQVTLGGK